jgi:hypothetical protein
MMGLTFVLHTLITISVLWFAWDVVEAVVYPDRAAQFSYGKKFAAVLMVLFTAINFWADLILSVPIPK